MQSSSIAARAAAPRHGLLLISWAGGIRRDGPGRRRHGAAVPPLRAVEAAPTSSGESAAASAPEACKGRRRVKREQPQVEEEAAAEVKDLNVVLTHAICDFDSLASAVGLAKLWSHQVRGQMAEPGMLHAGMGSFAAACTGETDGFGPDR
jgi:hypothetical protein